MIVAKKYCGGCRVMKPKTEFNQRKASNDGRAYRCRTCTKRYQEKYRARYPKSVFARQLQRQYNKRYRAQKRDLINYKRRLAREEVKRVQAIREGYDKATTVRR